MHFMFKYVRRFHQEEAGKGSSNNKILFSQPVLIYYEISDKLSSQHFGSRPTSLEGPSSCKWRVLERRSSNILYPFLLSPASFTKYSIMFSSENS